MTKKTNALNLVDMDVGLFVSYNLTAETLTTKLFRVFTLKTIPLRKVMDLRVADDTDVTPLNRLNWFRFKSNRQSLTPVYTLQAAESSPRIFMRLHNGSHNAMTHALQGHTDV